MSPMTKLAFFAALWLAAAPALAGEWTPADSGYEGYFAIVYSGEDLLPGEEAALFYSGATEVEYDAGPAWRMIENDVFFAIALTSGDEPITGFEGVSLRREVRGEDLETLYSTGADDLSAIGYPVCGEYTWGERPDGTEAQCVNFCFRNYDDMAEQRDAVACDSGEAHWIGIMVGGRLREKAGKTPAGPDATKNGRLTLAQKVAAANYLIVHVKWKGAGAALFQIDDTFRKAMWDMQ